MASYTVKSGDSLSRIAKAHDLSLNQLLALNPEFKANPNDVNIGDTLLVLTEFGEIVLVSASPERYHELASIQALDSANVTWNTPAFAPPYLLVRNSREAACYRLPLVDDTLRQ